jgi:hypothetical protein
VASAIYLHAPKSKPVIDASVVKEVRKKSIKGILQLCPLWSEIFYNQFESNTLEHAALSASKKNMQSHCRLYFKFHISTLKSFCIQQRLEFEAQSSVEQHVPNK